MKDNPAFLLKTKSIEWALYSYFFLIPIIYVIQVIAKNQFISLIPSLFLLAPFLIQVFAGKQSLTSDNTQKQKLNNIDYIMIFFFVITLLWLPVELTLYGVKSATSMAIRYIIPFLIYLYVSRYCNERVLFWLLCIISVMSFCVTVELFYENVCVRIYQYVPDFQHRSFEYVRDIVGGGEKQQFISYKGRPTGILEHLHATAFYIAIGVFAGIVIYFYKGWMVPLFFALCNFFVLFISGARVPFLSTIIIIVPFILIIRKDPTIARRIHVFAIITIIALIFGCVLLFSQWHVVHFYIEKLYILLFLKGQHAKDSFVFNDYLMNIKTILKGFSVHPWVLIAGVGPTTLISQLGLGSEDFFLLRLFAQYGLVGGIIFYLLFLIAIQGCCKRIASFDTAGRLIALFAVIILVMILLSTFHSPVMLRKAIYPFYFLSLGILQYFEVHSTIQTGFSKKSA